MSTFDPTPDLSSPGSIVDENLTNKKHAFGNIHKFGEALGSPAEVSEIGDPETVGTSENAAREDHAHAYEAPIIPEIPPPPDLSNTILIAQSVILGDQAIAGPGPTDVIGYTVTFVAPGGRVYKISSTMTMFVNPTAATCGWQLDLFRNTSTHLGRMGLAEVPSVGATPSGQRVFCHGMQIDVPPAGSVTYKISAVRYVGAAAVWTQGAGVRGMIMVEDIGAG